MSTEIICDDALVWLKQQKSLPNVVTGVCDLDEMPEGTTMNEYLEFYTNILEEVFSKLQDDCYAIFIQTDRNKRFYDFYESFNFKKIKKIKNKFFYSIQTQYIKDKDNYISNY